MTIYSVKLLKYEQNMKIKYGAGLCPSDIKIEGNMVKLVSLSFLGGWVAGALGLGGGCIFNPLLLSMGARPTVASASGMYMITFSTAASTFCFIIAEMLDIYYALWVGGFCMLGTILGMAALDLVMSKMGRQSPLVFLLCFVFFISVVAIPIFGANELAGKTSEELWRFGSIC